MATTITEAALQAATTIAKTTQTLIGAEINCRSYDEITLFVEYVNGNESGVLIQAHYLYATGGTAFQDASWSSAAGTKTSTLNEFKLTATANRSLSFDIRGIEYIKFTQGGSNNDGTPTGTLAANYSMTGSD